MTRKVTGQDLEQAYTIMAGIIRDYGERYLPIFKRVHDEVMQYRASQDLLRIALEMSSERNNQELITSPLKKS